MPPQQAARPPSRIDCLSAEGLVTRLVTGLQRCYEIFFLICGASFALWSVDRLCSVKRLCSVWSVFCSVERLLLCGASVSLLL